MSSGCGDVLSLEDLKTAKKHQVFEAEVITGREGGVASGGEIDYTTNPVTGQVQKTLPAILRDIGFDPASFDFTTGGTVTARDTVVYNPADNNWYSWAGALPHVVAAGTDPTADSNWKPRTDQLLRQNLGSSDGYKLIGRVLGYDALRVVEPGNEIQKIEVINTGMLDRWGGGIFNADLNDASTPDDGGVVIVTTGGKRWKRQFEGDAIHLVWFKTESNTWDDAWANAIKYGANLSGYAVRKIILPYGNVGPMTKPIIFDPNYGWCVEGTSGNGQKGTNLQFNIPKSSGYANFGALHHFPPDFVEVFNLRNVNITGAATRAAVEGEEGGWAYCHAVYCRAGNSTWFDVSMLNFRGSLLFDNAFDCAFYRVSTYAMGRMKDGYDYNNPTDVANSEATQYSPVTILSTRDGDSANHLRFYDGSCELQNVTPFIDVRTGTDISFIRMHGERPGRSAMSSYLPMGSFARIRNAEATFDSCGLQPNFTNSILFGNNALITISNCNRFGGIIKKDPSITGTGKFRLKLVNSIVGDIQLPNNMTQVVSCVASEISDVSGWCGSGTQEFIGCIAKSYTFNSSVPTTPLSSDYGVQIVGGSVSGNVTATASVQRMVIDGTYIAGDLVYQGSNGRISPSFVVGTESYNNAASNRINSPRGAQTYYVESALSEITGTVNLGSRIYKKAPTSGNTMGWICTTPGTVGGGGVFSPMPVLP